MRFFFFFQAEDGIRDLTVTGVQTCALPIYQQGAKIRCRKNGVPIPRLGGIVQSDAGRIDRWMAHLLSYSSNDQMQHLARRMVTASVEVLRPPGHKDSSDP